MNIEKEQIKHLAWLARIELDERELETYKEQIDKIIEYLNILDDVDTDAEPNYLTIDIEDLRNDVVKDCKDDVFSIVINKKDGFVKAPKMI